MRSEMLRRVFFFIWYNDIKSNKQTFWNFHLKKKNEIYFLVCLKPIISNNIFRTSQTTIIIRILFDFKLKIMTFEYVDWSLIIAIIKLSLIVNSAITSFRDLITHIFVLSYPSYLIAIYIAEIHLFYWIRFKVITSIP